MTDGRSNTPAETAGKQTEHVETRALVTASTTRRSTHVVTITLNLESNAYNNHLPRRDHSRIPLAPRVLRSSFEEVVSVHS